MPCYFETQCADDLHGAGVALIRPRLRPPCRATECVDAVSANVYDKLIKSSDVAWVQLDGMPVNVELGTCSSSIPVSHEFGGGRLRMLTYTCKVLVALDQLRTNICTLAESMGCTVVQVQAASRLTREAYVYIHGSGLALVRVLHPILLRIQQELAQGDWASQDIILELVRVCDYVQDDEPHCALQILQRLHLEWYESV